MEHYSAMKVRCKCGVEWMFRLPFTTFEQYLLMEHMKEHPKHDADFAVRSILGDVNAQTDIEILEAMWLLEDKRDEV
jgi:hypothetical protein